MFVSYVDTNSPAALAGLKFGDQIIQIDGKNFAGYLMRTVMKIIKESPKIVLTVRNRYG